MTSDGVEDSRQHGIDFRGVYADLLRFLPGGEGSERYTWRVSNNVSLHVLHKCDPRVDVQLSSQTGYYFSDPEFVARLSSAITCLGIDRPDRLM
jgi:hypothetical protein